MIALYTEAGRASSAWFLKKVRPPSAQTPITQDASP